MSRRFLFLQSISTKLFLIAFTSVVIVLIMIGIIAYSTIYVVVKENQEKSLQQSVEYVEDYLKWYMVNVQSQLVYFSNSNIYESLARENFMLLMSNYIDLNSDEMNAAYVIEDGNVVISSPALYRHWLTDDFIADVTRQAEQWGFWWSEPFDSGFGRAITVAKSFTTNDKAKKITIALELNVDSFVSGVNSYSPNKNIYVFSRSGEFLASNANVYYHREKIHQDEMVQKLRSVLLDHGNSFNTVHTSEGAHRVLKSDNNRWDWIVFAVVNERDAYPLLTAVQKQFFVIFLIWIVLSIFMANRLAWYIKKPISQIIKQMNKGSLGQLDTQISKVRKDEFGLISMHFNKMMQNIKELFENLKEAEERKRVEEIRVLHSQIKPHFLYNTLNAFYWLSETERVQEIGPLIQSLMGLLKYSIDKVGDVVPLGSEIKQLENYAELMRLRYGSVFELDVVIPDELLYLVSVPKLTLITLVENSIFYGLSDQRDVNHIIVTAAQSAANQVVIEVSDTGPGMEEEKIEQLFQKGLKRDSHSGLNNLGVRNIQERIELYYGLEYGLKIENNDDEGLMVRIQLPMAGSMNKGEK
ncbi:sensor histidine kinase [Paenibacillus sp. GXUN7292]|uniref:sensor histidine kinase n=1 Tax=Paenibacillus sp. GXUN7292 TaxID=3422499 RepID=UPI003D7C60AC